MAVCDVRKKVRDGKKAQVDQRYKSKDCSAYNDFRELLARDDIDAVHVATPDHWHTIIVTEACRHGKDVFCQKPETLTLREGSLMVDYARRYGRVVSGGSQRVLEDYRGTVDMCWGGKLGKVLSINVQTNNLSHACNLAPEPVPEGFDWEMWLLIAHDDPAVQAIMWQRYGENLTQLKGEAYRDQVFAYIEQEDTPRPLLYQLHLLKQVGFRAVEVLHKNAVFAAFGGIK